MTRFRLGPTITPEQRAFLDEHGYLHFSQPVTADEVAMLEEEIDAIGRRWVEEKRTQVYGIPLFLGRDVDGQPFIQRIAFASVFSERIRALVHDPRFQPVLSLVGDDARIGDAEKDGVVVNRYLNVPGSVHGRLGWHTDGLRDLFYGRMPQRMLNVGLHLDRVTKAEGGLRLIPGSHNQGFWSMCFRKPYFVSHGEDPAEICIETEPGDLTVHDGRLWHRVERSPHTGIKSQRRSIYLPYLTGPYEPKSDASPMPAYHRLGAWMRRRGSESRGSAA